jgi:hypothetical protein
MGGRGEGRGWWKGGVGGGGSREGKEVEGGRKVNPLLGT